MKVTTLRRTSAALATVLLTALALSGCSGSVGFADQLKSDAVPSMSAVVMTADEGHQGTVDRAHGFMDSFKLGDLQWLMVGAPDTLWGCSGDNSYYWELVISTLSSWDSADDRNRLAQTARDYLTSLGLTYTNGTYFGGPQVTAVDANGYHYAFDAGVDRSAGITMQSPCMALQDYQAARYKWGNLLLGQDPVVDYGTKQPYPMWATDRSWASLKAWVNPAFPPTGASTAPSSLPASSSAAG